MSDNQHRRPDSEVLHDRSRHAIMGATKRRGRPVSPGWFFALTVKAHFAR